jgi:hypothetical protein
MGNKYRIAAIKSLAIKSLAISASDERIADTVETLKRIASEGRREVRQKAGHAGVSAVASRADACAAELHRLQYAIRAIHGEDTMDRDYLESLQGAQATIRKATDLIDDVIRLQSDKELELHQIATAKLEEIRAWLTEMKRHSRPSRGS